MSHPDACPSDNPELLTWQATERAFAKRHPNYCRTCGGLGFLIVRYDPSDRALSLGPGLMTDYETCPTCGDRDLCPLCGQQNTVVDTTPDKMSARYECPCGYTHDEDDETSLSEFLEPAALQGQKGTLDDSVYVEAEQLLEE